MQEHEKFHLSHPHASYRHTNVNKAIFWSHKQPLQNILQVVFPMTSDANVWTTQHTKKIELLNMLYEFVFGS